MDSPPGTAEFLPKLLQVGRVGGTGNELRLAGGQGTCDAAAQCAMPLAGSHGSGGMEEAITGIAAARCESVPPRRENARCG
jgi:hypothetical protein